jgi:hypothetical protein
MIQMGQTELSRGSSGKTKSRMTKLHEVISYVMCQYYKQLSHSAIYRTSSEVKPWQRTKVKYVVDNRAYFMGSGNY